MDSRYLIEALDLAESIALEIDSDAKFEEFLQGIHGKPTNHSAMKAHGWWYYEFEDLNGNINTFYCHAYTDDEAYDVSYNGKYLADLLPKDHPRGYFTSVQELIDAYNKKLQTKEIEDEGGLAAQLQMEDKNTNKWGIHGDYARYTMSYGNSFKYDDIFEYDKQLTSYAKKINRQVGIDGFRSTRMYYPDEEVNKKDLVPNISVNKVWRYTLDPNILLVSLTGYHILTTESRFISDLENIKSEKMFKEPELHITYWP